jgi:hypothetical protein
MDEVIDPAMTVKVTGLFINILTIYLTLHKYLKYGGLKLYILCMNIFYLFHILLKSKSSLFKLNGFHILVKAKNKIRPHNKDVISTIIGSLLGDIYGNKRFVKGTRICFRQSNIHKEYLF